MAIVNGIMAEHMQEIIDETITSASVIGNTLRLSKEGGGVVEVNLVSVLAKVVENITADYTIVEADAGKLFLVTGLATITIPVEAIPIPIGSTIYFVQWGTDVATLAPSVDVDMESQPGLVSNGQWARFQIEKLSDTVWVASGDLTT